MDRAIAYYQKTFEILTRENFPYEWAQTSFFLGNAYLQFLSGDREENLKSAIDYYQMALQVRTRESFPLEWARTQINMGSAYLELPLNEQQAKNACVLITV